MSAENSYIRSSTPLNIVNESGGRGWGQWGLAIFKITLVNFEEGYAHLQSKTKETETYEYKALLTFPGGGRRSFFGMMPCAGDYAVVAFAPKESDGRANARQPVIISYFPPPSWLARDWVMGQDFEPSEGIMDSGANRDDLRGVADRVRYKMRAMTEGEALISSKHGSDIHLDEGVHISNRRANEIILRDQDQALITRSLQQFHTLAGARVYAGMVQRDARLLPTQMFSDGQGWDTSYETIGEGLFDEDFLTPSHIFLPKIGSSYDGESEFEFQGGIPFQDSLNPYEFLRWGLFIDDEGFRDTEGLKGYTSYGGKVFYRVGDDTLDYANSYLNESSPLSENSLTEYRIELKHTTNGTLPVSEQTDGFDADNYPEGADGLIKPNFVELVLGTYVGNEAFTAEGKETYGLPLVPVVFDGDSIVGEFLDGTSRPLNDQTAFSLIVTPPVDVRGRGIARDKAFISITKEGKLLANLVGQGGANGLELYSQGSMRLGSGDEYLLSTSKKISLIANEGSSDNNVGVNIRSEAGAVTIYGGGKLEGGTPDLNNQPDVLVEGSGVVQIKAKDKIKISAHTFDLSDTQSVSFNTGGAYDISANSSYTVSAENGKETYTNGHTTNISSNLPTNGASRQITIANLPTNPKAETYLSVFGDREETLLSGQHSTNVVVGRQVYQTDLGQTQIGAGLSSASFDSATGISVNSPQTISVNVGVNASYLSGGATTITSTALTSVNASGVRLVTPVLGGGVVSSTDIDPLSGKPLSTYNMGSVTVRLS